MMCHQYYHDIHPIDSSLTFLRHIAKIHEFAAWFTAWCVGVSSNLRPCTLVIGGPVEPLLVNLFTWSKVVT